MDAEYRRGPSVDPLNTIGMDRRDGNFEVAGLEIITYRYSRIPFEVNIVSKEMVSIFSWIGEFERRRGLFGN